MLNPADPAFVTALAAQLPPDTLTAPEPRHLSEPRSRWQGQAGAVARPRTVAEVSAILRACAAARVGVVPLGGGTGLVGGQVMPDGPLPLVLSLDRMTALRGIWPDEGVMIVEAGMILSDVQAHAADAGRLFPLSLASEGSARIGGTLATNAGGLNVLRYGNARALCLGVEAVLPDGSIYNGLKRLYKDNTGYDLSGLLVGSEGSLGIITAACLRLSPQPAHTVTALLVVDDPAAALRLLSLCQSRAAGMVQAFELIHRQGFDFLAETLPDIALPLSPPPEWCVLLELGLPAVVSPEEAMAAIYAQGDEAGLIRDGVIAASESQRAALWRIRESIPEANRRIGAISSHDISLPLSAIPDFIPKGRAALARLGDFRVNCFGHLGDGNLHFNVFPPQGKTRADYDALRGAIKTCIHDLVDAMGGSISAEHGIGRLKTSDLQRYGDPAKLQAMRAIKSALDPHGILNPGAVLA